MKTIRKDWVTTIFIMVFDLECVNPFGLTITP
jgi:hypothetical protein